MTLRAALLISGEADDAKAALASLDNAMEGSGQQAEELSRSYDKADKSIKELAKAQTAAQREFAETRAAFKAGEIDAEQYNRELLETKSALSLVEAQHRDAMRALRQAGAVMDQTTGSTRAYNAGLQQAGYQVSDFFVQVGSGTSVMRAFSLQAPQLVQAVQLMGGGAEGTKGKFASFAGFLAGPWGVALTVAVSAIGMLTEGLLDSADASDLAAVGADGLSQAQSVLGQIFDETSGRISHQNELLVLNARLTAVNLRAEALAQRESARSAFGNFDRGSMGLSTGQKVLGAFGVPVYGAVNREMDVRNLVRQVQSGTMTRQQALSRSEKLDFSGLAISRTEFQQALVDQVSADLKDKTASLIDSSLDSGQLAPELRRNSPRRSSGPSRSSSTGSSGRSSSMREAADAARELANFGKDAERTIDQLNSRFGEQPGLIAQGNQATAELDALIAQLGQRKPPGFEQLIEDANLARSLIPEAVLRPITQLREESQRRQQIDLLILSGRETEARVTEEIWRLEQEMGPLSAERRAEVEAIVVAEEEHLDRLEQAQKLQSAYLGTTQNVRQELEAIFAGKGDLSNFKQMFKDLKAKIAVEQIFGPTLDAFDDYVKENTAIDGAVNDFADSTRTAGGAATTFADTLLNEAARIANGGVGSDGGYDLQGEFDRTFGSSMTPEEEASGIIVVTGQRDEVREGVERSNTALAMTPEHYFEELSKRLAGPLLAKLDETLGVQFFSGLQGAVAGALYGSTTAGTTGGVLGFASGLFDQFGTDIVGPELGKSISQGLQGALGGAQTGTMVAGLGNMVGLNMSSTGAQLGGAVGSFIPIPGGQIIGSIAGGLLGGLFGSSPYGTATLGAGSISSSGKQADVASGLGGSVQGGLDRIIEALGAELGSYRVSIGTYNDSYRVSTTGYSGDKLNFKGSSAVGLHSFTNEADAIAFAIMDAISDGAVKGISAKMQKALKSSSDIDEAVAEALKVKELEELLAGPADLLGDAFAELNKEAEERLRLARAYGFEIVKVEELNAKERLALSEQLLDSQVGSLQKLIDDMMTGSLFAGTAVDQRAAILDAIDSAQGDVEAGVDGAADQLAELLRQLEQVSEEVYGSTGGYADDRSMILDNARAAIADANRRIEEASGGSDPALAVTNAALDENNDQNAEMIREMGSIREALEALASGGGSSAANGGPALAELAGRNSGGGGRRESTTQRMALY